MFVMVCECVCVECVYVCDGVCGCVLKTKWFTFVLAVFTLLLLLLPPFVLQRVNVNGYDSNITNT